MTGIFYSASTAIASTQAYHASQEASRASSKAKEVSDHLGLIKVDVEKLLMISEALWTILKEKHGYTDDELIRRIENIDLRDGKLDGKVAKSPAKPCPACNRVLIGNRPVCLYCGQTVKRKPFER
jgi:hypothetical protein